MLKYFVIISFCFMVARSSLDFGEFDIKVTKMENFKGPKRKDCAEYKGRVVNFTSVDMDFYVKEDVKTIKGKVIGFLNNKAMLRVQMKNLCDHIFFKPLIQGLFNNTDHCEINKGYYRINADISTITHSFYGGKFIYGNWRFRWTFYNDFCNLHCGDIYITMSPVTVFVGDKQ